VDDLQTLAAAGAATLAVVASLRPGRVTTAATDRLAGRFEAADLGVERQLAPAWVRADPRWLHQVITNLLTNALKFTPAGGLVRIETEAAGPDAVLRVTDTGAGIPPDELPHIFERFWRRRQAAQTSGRGSGRRGGGAGPGPRRPADRQQPARAGAPR
jgi:two-component system sensor histidine kinase BaeS